MKLLSNLLSVVALATVSPLVLATEEAEPVLLAPAPRKLQSTPSPTQAPGTTVRVYCFSGDSRVQVAGRGLVDLQDVTVGDQVLTGGKDRYQPVYAFGHYNPDERAEFLSVETHIPLEPLKLTPDHLVFVEGKDHPVRAASLTVGDVLVRTTTNAATPSRVSAIRSFVGQGTFTPLTHDGTLMVDGVLASSYISLQSDQDDVVEFPILGTSHHQWSHQDFVHWSLAPFRVVCGSVSSELCQLRTSRGIPYYIEAGIHAVQWAHRQGGLVEVVFLFFAFVLFGACRLVEVTVGVSSVGPLACAAVASYLYWKKHSMTKKAA